MSREQSLPVPELSELPEPPSSPPPMPRQRRPLRAFRSKKRTWSSSMHDYAPSSDPPVFSSDDGPDASVDNYTTPERRKRQYTGAWWAHDQQPGPSASSRKLAKNDDSGVWLPSDSSDDSALERLAAATLTSKPLPLEDAVRKQATDIFGRQSRTRLALAQEEIQQCLEQGNEVVDLSQFNLEFIPDSLLQPLHSLIKHPNVGSDIPSEEAYQSFIPSLKLYLAGNLLRTLPSELWRLHNLTVLSLRNNKLTHLPSAIGDLCNLQELNLAGNRLRWLPWELLKLLKKPVTSLSAITATSLSASDDEDDSPHGASMKELLLKLHKLLLRKQKQLEVEDPEFDVTARPDDAGLPWKQEPLFIAATAVSKMNFDGSLVRGSPPRPSKTPFEKSLFPVPSADHTPADDMSGSVDRVPTLFELALRSPLADMRAETVKQLLPVDTPDHVCRALDEAAEVQQCGGRKCSVCEREYIMPRCEWIEYWHYDPQALSFSADQTFIPFLRRTCSEACAAAVRQHAVLVAVTGL
ncbi:hypothetical protein K490DRAFT_53617 [Saccharata proteae CBS 121410]|uniref:L domain-like protein n=1 Tax=Saccharata proteae CBS 121410 TaxID=1314787 RepID=A0A9P4I147_9PEZI|nr:hypothetical protein K490DRAFT_53617 [Saccharata proteae CBS 121410]